MSKKTISNRTLIEPFADALFVIEVAYPLGASFTIFRGWSLTTSLDKFRNRDTVQMLRMGYWRLASYAAKIANASLYDDFFLLPGTMTTPNTSTKVCTRSRDCTLAFAHINSHCAF